jgi:hypothetical protein
MSRFVLIALVVMCVATMSVVLAFQKGETDYEKLEQQAAVAVVWGPAAAMQLALLLFGRNGPQPD